MTPAQASFYNVDFESSSKIDPFGRDTGSGSHEGRVTKGQKEVLRGTSSQPSKEPVLDLNHTRSESTRVTSEAFACNKTIEPQTRIHGEEPRNNTELWEKFSHGS